MRFITLISLLLFTQTLSAQFKMLAEEIDPNFSNPDLIYKRQYTNILGSPLYREDWAKGRLIMKNGDVLENLYLRYDAFLDEMIFKSRSQQGGGLSINKNLIKSAELTWDKQETQIFSVQRLDAKLGYFRTWEGNGFVLYQKIEKKIIPRVRKPDHYVEQKNKYDHFQSKEHYYVQYRQQLYRMSSLSPKNIAQIIPKSQEEVWDYARKQDLNLRKIAGVLAFLERAKILDES